MVKVRAVTNLFKPSLVIAIIAYVVTCTVLILVQREVFGGAIKTNWAYAVLYPVFIGYSALMKESDVADNDDETPATQKGIVRKKEMKFFGFIGILIIIAVIVGVVAHVIATGNPLQGGHYINRRAFAFDFQLIGLILTSLILAAFRKNKISGKRMFAAAYTAVLLATVAYLLFARPVTVSNAQNTLQNKGYRHVEYIRYAQEAFSIHFLMNFPDSDIAIAAADGLGVYIFVGEKYGEEYGIFVDIASGEHIMSSRLYDNISLSRSISQRR